MIVNHIIITYWYVKDSCLNTEWSEIYNSLKFVDINYTFPASQTVLTTFDLHSKMFSAGSAMKSTTDLPLVLTKVSH